MVGKLSAPAEPTELLLYMPRHRVLICKECRYAIQPSAIPRHLKETHKIYRSHRERYMAYTRQLDLIEPEDVPIPDANDGPISSLPVIDGFVCHVAECRHLCATAKRMKAHYNTEHREATTVHFNYRPAKMQTFFRGNKLKYFVFRQPQEMSTNSEQAEASSNNEATHMRRPIHDFNHDFNGVALGDAELLNHFQIHLAAQLATDATNACCWDTGPSGVPARHPFLKHGILSCSALHLAFMYPESRERYRLAAAHHQNLALPGFRAALRQPTVHNCLALLAFTQLLFMHCFAASRDEDDKFDFLLVQGRDDPAPDWLQVLRGSCHIFKPVQGYIQSQPMVAMMVDDADYDAGSANSYSEPQLDKLYSLVNAKHAYKPTEDQHSALLSALTLLSSAFVKARRAQAKNAYTLHVPLYAWAILVPDSYLELLKQRHPVAIILLAHYCLLFLPLEGLWYMQGYSKRIITRIFRQLDEQWRPWLQWPCEEVGLHCNHPTDRFA